MLTKKDVVLMYLEEVLPEVKKRYEKDGKRDMPARAEAWNDFTDMLRRDRQISLKQYETWTHPPVNRPRRKKNPVTKSRKSAPKYSLEWLVDWQDKRGVWHVTSYAKRANSLAAIEKAVLASGRRGGSLQVSDERGFTVGWVGGPGGWKHA